MLNGNKHVWRGWFCSVVIIIYTICKFHHPIWSDNLVRNDLAHACYLGNLVYKTISHFIINYFVHSNCVKSIIISFIVSPPSAYIISLSLLTVHTVVYLLVHALQEPTYIQLLYTLQLYYWRFDRFKSFCDSFIFAVCLTE